VTKPLETLVLEMCLVALVDMEFSLVTRTI